MPLRLLRALEQPRMDQVMGTQPDYSYEFYRRHAGRYASWWATHTDFDRFGEVSDRLADLMPARGLGLDAGCGPSGKELLRNLSRGFDVIGVDAVEENLRVALVRHPELRGRLILADLTRALSFSDARFDFVTCTTVIQHIRPEAVTQVTLPELVRMLKVGGILQLAFKNGTGVTTVYDQIYGLRRSFQLYEPEVLLGVISGLGMKLIPEETGKLGGLMYYVDSKGMETCVFLARKVG